MAKFYLIAGWLGLVLVAFVTLAPLYLRPEVAPAHIEHFAAFFALGLVFFLAYPNRIGLVVLVVIGAAVALETLQLLTIDRHGRLVDALFKVTGGACGITLSWLVRGAAQVAKESSSQVAAGSHAIRPSRIDSK